MSDRVGDRVFTAQQKIDAMTRFYESHLEHQRGLFAETGHELNRIAANFAEDVLEVLHWMDRDDPAFPPPFSERECSQFFAERDAA